MHDSLFGDPRNLDDAGILLASVATGVVPGQFSLCMDGEGAKDVQVDTADARALGVTSTPTFLIGRTLPSGLVNVSDVIRGARPVGDFRRALDKLLIQADAR
jgi:predicted DsbA family dithiol-disulfide isomerase